MHYIRSFLKGCQTYKLHKVASTPQNQCENRTNLSYISMIIASCDIKYMSRASTNQIFIHVVTNELTDYLVTILCIEGPHITLESIS